MRAPVWSTNFRLNAAAIIGLAWIALCAVVCAWVVVRYLLSDSSTAADWAIPSALALGVGPYALVPGYAAWWFGKRQAGYEPGRHLRAWWWRVPQAIGVACAVAYWVLGALPIVDMLRGFGSCGTDAVPCVGLFMSYTSSAMLFWLPGWLLYWISTRP